MSHPSVQAKVDTLEVEKDTLGQEIDSLMMDRQNLLQVKMSLGLEVATYRYLSSLYNNSTLFYVDQNRVGFRHLSIMRLDRGVCRFGRHS